MSIPRSRSSVSKRAAAAALLFAGVILAGCSASSLSDHIPTAAGGLPDGAPPRPAAPPAYPGVHDLPRARDSAVLTDEEQTKLEADLAKARDRLGSQSSSAAQGSADAKGGSSAKPAGSARKP